MRNLSTDELEAKLTVIKEHLRFYMAFLFAGMFAIVMLFSLVLATCSLTGRDWLMLALRFGGAVMHFFLLRYMVRWIYDNPLKSDASEGPEDGD